MRRPIAYVAVIVPLLLVAGLPFLRVEFGGVDHRALPEGTESRVVSESLLTDFPGGGTTTIDPVVTFADGSIDAGDRAALGRTSTRWPPCPASRSAEVTATDGGTALVEVRHGYEGLSTEARALVGEVRDVPDAGRCRGPRGRPGGRPARPARQPRRHPAVDGPVRGRRHAGPAVPRLRLRRAARQGGGDERAVADGVVRCAWSGSSRRATCRSLLGFTSTGCHRGHPADPDAGHGVRAVDGLRGVPALPGPRGSGTGPATTRPRWPPGCSGPGASSPVPPVLLVVVIGAFATSGIVFIKMIGVGMVIAIIIDATVVRALLVPATMRLLGQWNWWAPAPLARFWARHGIRETEPVVSLPEQSQAAREPGCSLRHWPGERAPGRRGAGVDRLGRHPGARRRPARPGPVPGGRAGRRRRQRRAAGPAGARARRRGRRGGPGQRRPGPAARVLRRGQGGRLRRRRAPGAQDPGRAGRRDRAGPAGPATSCSTAITGSIGLAPDAGRARAPGRTLALANKESLVAGGPLVKAAVQRPDQIVPVDSEHSALAQCLRGGRPDEVRRLVLTASGGPFRGRTPRRARTTSRSSRRWRTRPGTWARSSRSTPPPWSTRASSCIEAHLLFDIPLDRIDVVVHPQSVVHSMVEFVDGSTLAQASPPDMRLPIALGLGWPDRVPGAAGGCDWTTAATWEFLPLDDEAFPAVRLARAGGRARRHRPGRLQRRQRGLRGGVRRGPAAVHRYRGHPRAGARRARGRERRERSRTSSTPRGWARGSAPPTLTTGRTTDVSFWIGVLIFAVGILVSVCLHEAGHLLTAKRFGMKATQYFAGFGPTLWSFQPRRDRVRHQGDPGRRLREDRRDDPARGGRARRTGTGPSGGSRSGSARSCSSPARRPTSLLALLIFYAAAVATGLPNPAAPELRAAGRASRWSARSPTCVVPGFDLTKDKALRRLPRR